ncbi:NAD(P)-dependent oxidoreductase [Verrucomicrobiaceae bacterium N1E253]|uniref:NAD(P)-dependent oxidoreductase n=1 Tax=Oceaniferula marina TaxID=2748318 RepID=A0A851GJ25_9BACT|nr:NAD(P)-dependent oxidoreductase [Oceaniferula marina]NWK55117.1 NAD(P)-dependent oxidoreductase [Oceaniferula marina]
MSTTTSRIAVIGLGRMGANMARHLTDCGYTITSVYDILPQTTQELANELGSTAATSPSQVCEEADVILTVVTDDTSMRELFSPDQLLTQATGKTFINCATVSPEVHQEVEAACQAAGAHSLEACMASSISQAREGKLYLMIGGERAVFDQHQALLETLSTNLRYIGPAGQAAKVKALVNMVMNINTAALAEGLGLGDALGLDTKMLCEVFAQTGANSRVLETDADDMIDRDHECWFSASHAAKDSGIANSLAAEAGVEVPLSQATEHQYQRMIDAGLGELDKSGIAELTFPGRS